MPILTKKEFADMIGWSTSQLSVYIKRGKVFIGDGDLINSDHEVNVLFLKKRLNKSGLSKDIAQKSINTDDRTGIENGTNEDIASYEESEKKLKYLDTLKREYEISLLEIKQAKLKGEVVPSILLAPIILQHNHSLMNSMKNGGEELLRKVAKLSDLSAGDIATLKGDLVSILNQAINTAAQNTAAAIGKVIDDYSNSRGVGERL